MRHLPFLILGIKNIKAEYIIREPMKLFLQILFFFSSAGMLSADDVIYLSNGDVINGKISSISKDQKVYLEHHAVGQPIQVQTTKIEHFVLNQGLTKQTHIQPDLLTLSNGDSIGGELLEIDDSSITLKTEFAGTYKIPRKSVSNIDHGSAVRGALYQFNHSKKLFTKNKNWKINRDAIEANSHAIMWQKFDLPKDFRVKFTLEWNAIPDIVLHLGAVKNSTLKSNSRYTVKYNMSGIRLESYVNNKLTKIGANNSIGPHSINSREMNFELRFSRSQRKITILCNGMVLQTFRDTSIRPPKGRFIGIQNITTNATGPKILNLEVLTWNSLAPTLSEEDYKTNDVITVNNTNVHSGKLISLKKDDSGKLQCRFANEQIVGGEMTLPMSMISSIRLANSQYKPNKNEKSRFYGGIRLSLNTISLKNGQLQAEHEILGNFTAPRESILSLKLNNKN